MFSVMINNLENNPSILAKKSIVKEYLTAYPYIRDMLDYALNVTMNFYVKEKSLTKILIETTNQNNDFANSWDNNNALLRCDEHGWNVFKPVLNNLMTRVYTGNKALSYIKTFFDRVEPEEKEYFKRILLKDLRCNTSQTIVNAVINDLGMVPIFDYKVQLANEYDPNKNYKVNTWWASPKMDGFRMTYVYGNGIFSRDGKKMTGFDHIENEMEILCNKYNLNFLDGELFTDTQNFETLAGIINRTKNINEEDKKLLFFNMFACCKSNGDFESTSVMVKLINKIKKDMIKNPFQYIRFVDYTEISNNEEEIKRQAEQYVNEGYEGIMLRNPDVYYDWKRSDKLLKFKFFKEVDLKIVGIIKGSAGKKFSNTMGSIVCEGVVEGKPIKVEVGSGFNELSGERDEFYNNPNKFIGQNVEIQYQNITNKERDGYYSLRFPTFKKMKFDR
jgi:ATP-dependent DNA ligase